MRRLCPNVTQGLLVLPEQGCVPRGNIDPSMLVQYSSWTPCISLELCTPSPAWLDVARFVSPLLSVPCVYPRFRRALSLSSCQETLPPAEAQAHAFQQVPNNRRLQGTTEVQSFFNPRLFVLEAVVSLEANQYPCRASGTFPVQPRVPWTHV